MIQFTFDVSIWESYIKILIYLTISCLQMYCFAALNNQHCVKSVRIRIFSGLCGPEKLQIRTLVTQCKVSKLSRQKEISLVKQVQKLPTYLRTISIVKNINLVDYVLLKVRSFSIFNHKTNCHGTLSWEILVSSLRKWLSRNTREGSITYPTKFTKHTIFRFETQIRIVKWLTEQWTLNIRCSETWSFCYNKSLRFDLWITIAWNKQTFILCIFLFS